MRDILEYFPLPEPRPQQVQALKYVQDVIGRGYTDIVLELPTGSGKSACGCAIAAWAQENLPMDPVFRPGAYILVQQKVLQDQIESELDRLGAKAQATLIKASVEYICPMFKRCSAGMVDRRCNCIELGQCVYKIAKGRFISATVAVTNYSYYFCERSYVGQIEPRCVLVMDEVHNLSQAVLRMVDVVVSEEKLPQYAPSMDADDFIEIAKSRSLSDFIIFLETDYLPAVNEQAEIMLALNDSDENIKEAYEIAQHFQKVQSFVDRAKSNPHGWVFWKEENRDGKITLTARPLDAAPYFDELVGKESKIRVYLSAFPGPKGIFCSELGLDPKKVAWMRQRSQFLPVNRPVHLLGVGSMSRARQEVTLPAVLRMVRKIIEAHPDTRGIIHTHSYKLADSVAESLTEFEHRLVYPKNADQREEALKTHAQLPAGILISPSVGEGFDFRGDLARWQILCKVPYPSLGNKHTAAMAERNPLWYKAETVKHFLQICGRITRSVDDFGETFVLDSDITQVLRETSSYLPTWFREGVFSSTGEPFFTE